MRAYLVMFALGVAFFSLPACSEYGGKNRDLAVAASRPDGCITKLVRSAPAFGSICRTEQAELLRKDISRWLPGLQRKVAVYALIVDARVPHGPPPPTIPYWTESWSDSDQQGRQFAADWISGEGRLLAVLYFRPRGNGVSFGLPPLVFLWNGHRWRCAWPNGWTRANRRKFRHFVYLAIAGRLPATIKGINGLLPGPAKLLPMHIWAHIRVGPTTRPDEAGPSAKKH